MAGLLSFCGALVSALGVGVVRLWPDFEFKLFQVTFVSALAFSCFVSCARTQEASQQSALHITIGLCVFVCVKAYGSNKASTRPPKFQKQQIWIHTLAREAERMRWAQWKYGGSLEHTSSQHTYEHEIVHFYLVAFFRFFSSSLLLFFVFGSFRLFICLWRKCRAHY